MKNVKCFKCKETVKESYSFQLLIRCTSRGFINNPICDKCISVNFEVDLDEIRFFRALWQFKNRQYSIYKVSDITSKMMAKFCNFLKISNIPLKEYKTPFYEGQGLKIFLHEFLDPKKLKEILDKQEYYDKELEEKLRESEELLKQKTKDEKEKEETEE